MRGYLEEAAGIAVTLEDFFARRRGMQGYLLNSFSRLPAVCAAIGRNAWQRELPLPVTRAIARAALAAIAATAAIPAHADFRLCNNSTRRISVSLAYTDGETWISEGWWNLKPAACEILVRGPLAAEYYYVYAMDEHGGEWKGKAFMCTRDREFRIIGREDCFVRGFDRTGFFEIDTGKDARNWTVQLTDSAAQPNP